MNSHLRISLLFLLLCILLSFINLMPPPPIEAGIKAKAIVVETDDSDVMRLGVTLMGSQRLTVRVISGPYKGRELPAYNQLRSNLELDKLFKPGDKILIGIPPESENASLIATAQDYYRLNWSLFLFGIFSLLLVFFAGATGFKALISFIFSCVVVWKLLVPLCLMGYSPVGVCFVCVTLLTIVIIILVAGFTRRFLVACLGSLLGIFTGCLLSTLFTHLLNVNGATLPYSQALLNSGFENLNLQELFAGAVILASSGAVMDLGMDVSVGQEELVRHKPDITQHDLFMSGIRIGQNVVGTMTTTLLLAYSGGYLTLMMTFLAQGTRAIDFINNPYVAAELVKTLIGSFALVLVAPFTALTGSIIYKRHHFHLPSLIKQKYFNKF